VAIDDLELKLTQLVLLVYSLDLGIPFVVAALAAEPFAAFLARFRAHLGLVEKAMGALWC
jgi:cytochrome c-type biogenesis protein